VVLAGELERLRSDDGEGVRVAIDRMRSQNPFEGVSSAERLWLERVTGADLGSASEARTTTGTADQTPQHTIGSAYEMRTSSGESGGVPPGTIGSAYEMRTSSGESGGVPPGTIGSAYQ
jgi:hypothetical protein